MSFTNSNVTKIQKKARFNHEEASERLTKGRKLNKTNGTASGISGMMKNENKLK